MEKIKLLAASIVISLSLSSCWGGSFGPLINYSYTTTSYEESLGNVESESQILFPPTHIKCDTAKTLLKLSPRISFDFSGEMQHNTASKAKPENLLTNGEIVKVDKENLKCNTYTNFGADLELYLSQTFSFFGGVYYAQTEAGNINGNNYGIGLNFNSKKSNFRLDIGFMNNQSIIRKETLIKETNRFYDWDQLVKTTIREYSETEREIETSRSPFISLAWSTTNPNNALNYYISFSFFDHQSFKAQINGSDLVENWSFYTVTPGCSIKIVDNMYLLSGLRISYISMGSNGTEYSINPSLQIDYKL